STFKRFPVILLPSFKQIFTKMDLVGGFADTISPVFDRNLILQDIMARTIHGPCIKREVIDECTHLGISFPQFLFCVLVLRDVMHGSDKVCTITCLIKDRRDTDLSRQLPAGVMGNFLPTDNGLFFDSLPVFSQDQQERRFGDDLVHFLPYHLPGRHSCGSAKGRIDRGKAILLTRFDSQLKDGVPDSIIDRSQALFVFMECLLLQFPCGNVLAYRLVFSDVSRRIENSAISPLLPSY